MARGAGSWRASWAKHLVHLYCLIRSFAVADMISAYPIARGGAPALASVVAVSVFGEAITWPIAAGIALVSGGVITVGLGRHVEPRALVSAGFTGVTIALYAVIDGQGVRAAPSTGSYIVWTYLALGDGIGGLFAAWRGTAFAVAARTEWRAGLMAGALSIMPYASALAAYRTNYIGRGGAAGRAVP